MRRPARVREEGEGKPIKIYSCQGCHHIVGRKYRSGFGRNKNEEIREAITFVIIFVFQIVIIPFRGDRGAAGGIMSDTLDESVDTNKTNASSSSSSPVLPSYTLDLKSVITNNAVDNIVDLQFLHGYNQPTLLILYEPLKTFPGYEISPKIFRKRNSFHVGKLSFRRIAVRKDTCRMDVLTLDVKERISAFIWSKEVRNKYQYIFCLFPIKTLHLKLRCYLSTVFAPCPCPSLLAASSSSPPTPCTTSTRGSRPTGSASTRLGTQRWKT